MNQIRLPQITGLSKTSISFLPFLDKIPVGICILSLDCRVVLFNQAMEILTGFSREKFCGVPCCYLLRSNICVQGCPLPSIKPDSGPTSFEANIINRDREKIPVRITLEPIVDISGKHTGFLEVVEDIRLLKEANTELSRAYSFGKIIGKSPQMERLYRIVPMIAQTDSPILITGETGTGKDLLAEVIHRESRRAKGPFIKVNCGALPENLLETELFGHKKGAFTGAIESRQGRFHLAHNGTLYLTEIGDLPLPLQVKLLTFLDDKIIHPLGDSKSYHVDVRIVAATHRNLEQMVREKRFREDLLFRLNVVRLELPPLRERKDDVRLLVDYFLARFASQFKKRIRKFSDEALRVLLRYPYPGNVRELKNIVEYSVNICTEDTIQEWHLPAYLFSAKTDFIDDRLNDKEQLDSVDSFLPAGALKENLDWETMEKKMIIDALLKAKGKKGKAAAFLGWGRSTLWRKMKQYGISS